MADVRINALATTATTAAADDYLALDGSANGTRKILATNVAQNVTDVTFGTSGPSAKSSIAARAPRQGLVFDGTAGATVSAAIPALGTGDFTLTAWVRLNNASASGAQAIIGSTYGGTRGVAFYRDASGNLVLDRAGIVNMGYAALSNQTAGVTQMLTAVRASGVLTMYQNGIALSTTQTSPTANLDGVSDIIGSLSGGTTYVVNGVVAPLAYNRALSASEVVSLYEAGAPAGADYNNASNTSVVTSAFVNSGYSTFSGASATGFTAAAASGSNYATSGNASSTLTVKKGSSWRLTFSATLTSGAAPTVALRGSTQEIGTTTVVAGSNSLVITMPEAGTSDSVGFVIFRTSGATSYAISSFSLTPLGLLLAPDIAQAGGGSTWYDTSGNAANITLPASGVAWAVPSSAKTATGWTFGGNLTVSGTGTSSVAGNLLLGTTTDSGNGRIQLATHTTSAGGIGFGTDTSLYTQSAGNLTLDHLGGTNPVLNFRENAVAKAYIGTSGSILYVGTNTANNVVLQTNATTALTLDSSQRCILAGALRLNNAYTAGAPTATGYVTLQDSAGNTYKVLVGT